MQKEIQRTGGSLCVIIPSDIAEEMQLEFKTKIDIQYINDQHLGKEIIIKKVAT